VFLRQSGAVLFHSDRQPAIRQKDGSIEAAVKLASIIAGLSISIADAGVVYLASEEGSQRDPLASGLRARRGRRAVSSSHDLANPG
jgi:hypothetical protein